MNTNSFVAEPEMEQKWLMRVVFLTEKNITTQNCCQCRDPSQKLYVFRKLASSTEQFLFHIIFRILLRIKRKPKLHAVGGIITERYDRNTVIYRAEKGFSF